MTFFKNRSIKARRRSSELEQDRNAHQARVELLDTGLEPRDAKAALRSLQLAGLYPRA